MPFKCSAQLIDRVNFSYSPHSHFTDILDIVEKQFRVQGEVFRSRSSGAGVQERVARCRTHGAGVQEQVTKSVLMSRSRCLFSGASVEEQEKRSRRPGD